MACNGSRYNRVGGCIVFVYITSPSPSSRLLSRRANSRKSEGLGILDIFKSIHTLGGGGGNTGEA